MKVRKWGIVLMAGWALIGSAWAGGADSVEAFGDHLFRQGDFYRAITEYERVLFQAPDSARSPAVRLKIGAAYFRGEKWEAASRRLQEVRVQARDTEAGRQALLYLAALALRQRDWGRALNYLEEYRAAYPADARRNAVMAELILTHLRRQEGDQAGRLLEAELAASESGLPLTPADLRAWAERPYKSPRLAGGLSAVLPGAGQAYVGRWGDASLAFVINGLFIWGAWAAFDRDEDVAGSVLLALEATWYAGNIYNAVNGARKENRLVEDRFMENVRIRYGLTFPPDGGEALIPVIGISGSF
jgi:outer membrane protein assembly factor BamD (BamD/ComL family)